MHVFTCPAIHGHAENAIKWPQVALDNGDSCFWWSVYMYFHRYSIKRSGHWWFVLISYSGPVFDPCLRGCICWVYSVQRSVCRATLNYTCQWMSHRCDLTLVISCSNDLHWGSGAFPWFLSSFQCFVMFSSLYGCYCGRHRLNPLTSTVAILVKHPVPDRVKPSFVPVTLALTLERQSARMSKITNDSLAQMFYSCTRTATVASKD